MPEARPGRADAEFLRWMLSDGAGRGRAGGEPRPTGLSLRVDWVAPGVLRPRARRSACTPAPRETRTPGAGATWLDQPTIAGAEAAGLLHLRQDTRALPGLVELGVAELARLTLRGLVDPARVDHLLCHYSSEHFRPEIHRLLDATGLSIPAERWFTNLPTSGNTGAASIFVMLEECWRSGRFRPGDRVLLMVPESGRFTVAFAHLTCVAGPRQDRPAPAPSAAVAVPAGPPAAVSSPLGEPAADDGEVARWLLLQLALVWADFERRLRSVELVRRIEQGEVTLGEYQRLLVNLRQQVVDGGRWIARAASSMSAELFPLRSAFILHAGEEHRDYQLLEQDYLAVGGSASVPSLRFVYGSL